MTRVKKESDYELPPPGTHVAVCCDHRDMGYQDTPWGEKHKVDLAWMLAAQREDGLPHVVTKRYTASLDERSNLSLDLETWWARALTDEERIEGIELEFLVGNDALVTIIHEPRQKGGLWAAVRGVIPLMPGMDPVVIPLEFKRWKDRPKDDTEFGGKVDAIMEEGSSRIHGYPANEPDDTPYGTPPDMNIGEGIPPDPEDVL